MSVSTANSAEYVVPTGVSSLPVGSIQAELFGLREEIKKVGDKTTHLNLIPLKGLKSDLDRLVIEELDAVKQSIEAANNQNAWSHQQLIYSLGSAAASIIGGAYLVASGEEQGKKFVGVGAVSLANILMEHLGGWSALAKIGSMGNSTLEAGIKLVPIAITIFTNIYSAYTMLNLPIEHKTWMTQINQILSYINLALQVGSVYTTYKKGQADFRLLDVQSQTNIATKKIQPITLRNEYLGERFNSVTSTLKKTLLNITRINSAMMAN